MTVGDGATRTHGKTRSGQNWPGPWTPATALAGRHQPGLQCRGSGSLRCFAILHAPRPHAPGRSSPPFHPDEAESHSEAGMTPCRNSKNPMHQRPCALSGQKAMHQDAAVRRSTRINQNRAAKPAWRRAETARTLRTSARVRCPARGPGAAGLILARPARSSMMAPPPEWMIRGSRRGKMPCHDPMHQNPAPAAAPGMHTPCDNPMHQDATPLPHILR
jgi:hypothetical protein